MAPPGAEPEQPMPIRSRGSYSRLLMTSVTQLVLATIALLALKEVVAWLGILTTPGSSASEVQSRPLREAGGRSSSPPWR